LEAPRDLTAWRVNRADWSGAEDGHVLAGLNRPFPRRLQADRPGLEHRSLDEVQLLRQAIREVGRNGGELGEVAVGVRHAVELDIWAEVILAVLAVVAATARDARLQRHAVAHLKGSHRGADLHHLARGLVAKNERAFEDGVADASFVVQVHVGTTDADRLDAHEHFVGGWDGTRHLFDA
jgi:hypothetical protein